VRLLSQDPRIDIMANKNEVIKNAGKERRLDIVRLLAKAQGFDPQGTNQELFYWAISNKLFKVVTALTELPDVNPQTPLCFLFRNKNGRKGKFIF